MANKLPINPDKIHWLENFEPSIIPSIHLKNYRDNVRYREIIIFCSSLVDNMNWFLKFKFWWKGQYYKALIKTYDELLTKRSRKVALPSSDVKWIASIDDYYVAGIRGKMVVLCSDLLSKMSRYNRFRFTYLLQYHPAIYKTYTKTQKKIKKK